ncbi:hypothetical protein JYK14_07795 [Siccirubricoccus sp. KC 17139]|uniref:Uncharacterized protein n=1 Tax=Siccirubricoccus soli TaxID=2899147 RepID=A0ABT1D384_9PROT|nr:hypothetical protein [Siccirubricoccus soli]MCO6416072.1 hypothetical protein [Siccirubricoccus soli]MCP2682204.1 hypothetical protein [Siccirubricoccus soli]
MRTFIANFGKENFAWPACLSRGTIAVLDDEEIHRFWEARNRQGYIAYARKHLKTAGGITVPRPVASRWYNLNDLLFETDGDVWIHRQRGELWWTRSTGAEPEREVIVDPKPRKGNATGKVVVYHKRCTGWSDRDSKGRPLRWDALHPRAKEFLFTEGTFQCLGSDNAAYAIALIEGEDLSAWHGRADWKSKQERAKKSPVTYADARKKTIIRMAMTAMATAAQSGAIVTTTRKDKEVRFPTQLALENHIGALMEAQEGLCALTGLEMQLDGGDDPALCYSLDRIDSDGHYEAGNLQLVCKFANAWKGATANAEFRRLVEMIRASGA